MKKHYFQNRTRGFTLVEIMIVVTIIGILASLAVPAFQRARWKSLETSIKNNLKQIWNAGQQYMMENGVDHVTYSDIVQWRKKDGTTTVGTNLGFSSVIAQVADEDYDTIKCYLGTVEAGGEIKNPDAITPNEYNGDSPSGAVKVLYENAVGLQVMVGSNEGGNSKDRYVKLAL